MIAIRPPKKEWVQGYFMTDNSKWLDSYIENNFGFIGKSVESKKMLSLIIVLQFGNDEYRGLVSVDNESNGRYVYVKVKRNDEPHFEKKMLRSKWINWLREIITSMPLLTEFDRYKVSLEER